MIRNGMEGEGWGTKGKERQGIGQGGGGWEGTECEYMGRKEKGR